MIYADIIIDISHEKLDRTFQYLVPEELTQKIRIGMVVLVPFGNGNHQRKGYVIGLSEECKFDSSRIKAVYSLCSDEETTESKLIALAAWMKEHYGSTMIQALKTVLPIQNKMKAKEKRLITLAVSEEEAEKFLDELKKTRYHARIRLLEAVLAEKKIETARATKELGASSSVVNYFREQGILTVESEEISRNPLNPKNIPVVKPCVLNEEQERAVQSIRTEWAGEQKRPALLYGVTGSGKTQVYMELIEEVLRQGQEAIVLIPEIALTYQTVLRFYGRFGDRVSVINSRLSQGERYDQFKRARAGEIQVMVGPRSALFTPFAKLGLIIIDEEHEPTYKSENSPRYHTREAAVKRAQMEGARLLMGSATPSVEAFEKCETGEYALIKLDSRFGSRPLPSVSVVDMREELKSGNRQIFSRQLRDGIQDCIQKKEQVILFLNRRGYAGFVSCRSCGYVIKCPHCDVSLSEHQGNRLICHYCGYEKEKPKICPECGSPYIGGFKAGTQQIEQVLKKDFPGIRVLRMDYDTTRNKGSYEKILETFAQHQADVLIGTQMIVKGHDFPGVTLVGVIAADLSLNTDDFRCGERTFQLLTQAVGRAGRGEKPGMAVIQTYHPEHYSIQAAIHQDYMAFYQEEISYRILLDYPPAAHMLAIMGAGEQEELLDMAMHYIGKFVEHIIDKKEMHMIGPAPEPVGKVKDVYRRVLYLKHRDHATLEKVKDKVERYIEINSGFKKLHIQFDFS